MKTRRSYKKLYCTLLMPVMAAAALFAGIGKTPETMAGLGTAYESLLFNDSFVHSIDIETDHWEEFLSGCTDKSYVECNVTIDGESYRHVAIRAKGNTSLTRVASYGNDRYSFKIEFDHYNKGSRYHGLDKLSLNNIIQDNTYMKDYLTYRMMGYFGVAAPLCSFTYITVNGEDWGLYLAVEGVEDAFLSRCYGKNPGNLYKPDSMKMGGGRDSGDGFPMSGWSGKRMTPPQSPDKFGSPGGRGSFADGGSRSSFAGGGDFGGFAGGGRGSFASGGVSLVYTGDDYDSYENIFSGAKTDPSDKDKSRLISALKSLNAGENIAETVDVDQVIRYFTVHNFVCNFDSYTGPLIHNYYLYEENGQLSMIPWDYNLAFGGYENATDATALVNYPIDTPVFDGETDSRPMLAWIFANEAYTALYHQYFSTFISSFFESGLFEETVEETRAMIAPYVEKDPTKFCTYEEFESGTDALKNFCLLRAKSVRGQLDGSIPADSEGQAAHKETLIKASSLKISDMGTMH